MDQNRRQFLKKMSASGFGLGLASGFEDFLNLDTEDEIQQNVFNGAEEPPPLNPKILDIKRESFAKVVIVGSGYGSAVTALRLAEAGVPSVIIEMGRLWNKKGKDGKIFANSLFPDERSMWLDEKTSSPIKSFYGVSADRKVARSTGILDVRKFDGIETFMGRGVGGGSLVNMAMMVRAKSPHLRKILPTDEVNRFYSHFYPLAERNLKVNSVAKDFFEKTKYYNYSRIALRHLEKIGAASMLIPSGYDFNYLQLEAENKVVKSALKREAGFGNNHGKNSLDKTYLAKAFSTGLVQLVTLTEIKNIAPSKTKSGHYTLDYVQRHEASGNIEYSGSIDCRYLFLGAGSLGTTELLLRSKAKGHLPSVPSEVGQNWGNNSEVFVVRTNGLLEPSGVKQSAVPTGASRVVDQDNQEVFIMHLPMLAPIPVWISWHAAMTEADVSTQIRFNLAKDSIEMSWGQKQSTALERKAKYIFDQVNAKASTKYNAELFGEKKPFSTKSAYHLMGGCALNRATDPIGGLKNYENIFVTDGSLLPNFLGVNPALTITALAERNIERIIQEKISELI